MKYFYAVQRGRKTGLYESWADCAGQVQGFPGAVYKKFASREAAEQFLRQEGYGGGSSPRKDPVTAEKPERKNASAAAGPRKVKKKSLPSLSSITKEEILREFEEIDSDWLAYVDGSFHAESSVFGYGVLLLGRDGSLEPFQGSGTDAELSAMRNVAGEIHGAMRAAEEAQRLNAASLTILYDYLGIEYWVSGRWKANKQGTQRYRDSMRAIRKTLPLHFKKVKAHSGVLFNELVDQLAKQAVGLYSSAPAEAPESSA